MPPSASGGSASSSTEDGDISISTITDSPRKNPSYNRRLSAFATRTYSVMAEPGRSCHYIDLDNITMQWFDNKKHQEMYTLTMDGWFFTSHSVLVQLAFEDANKNIFIKKDEISIYTYAVSNSLPRFNCSPVLP